MADLTDKQQAFIEHYLIHFNGAEAARQAGYSEDSARWQAYENLRHPEIRAAIDERLAEFHMTANEVLARLSLIARGDMTDFLDENGNIDVRQGIRRGKGYLIKSYRRRSTQHGEEITLELHDPLTALKQLGKALGLDKEIVEVDVGAELRELLRDFPAPWAVSPNGNGQPKVIAG